MSTRRINYFLLWCGCLLFFWAYRQWICWTVLVIVTLLPLFSVLVSLPGICAAKSRPDLPEALDRNTPCPLRLTCSSVLPIPDFDAEIEVRHSFSDRTQVLRTGDPVPTDHCGILTVRIVRLYICDCLGLFRFRLPAPAPHRLMIRPAPLSTAPSTPPSVDIPIHDGRIGPQPDEPENCEPRPAQQGDSLRHIHRKLSAKMGIPIINEPSGAQRQALLRLHLCGTCQELDRKLELLLWLTDQLLAYRIPCQIECFSGSGCERWAVESASELTCAIDSILSRSRSTTRPTWSRTDPDLWRYEIGGCDHEA